mgnify:CR=1 FL=1
MGKIRTVHVGRAGIALAAVPIAPLCETMGHGGKGCIIHGKTTQATC